MEGFSFAERITLMPHSNDAHDPALSALLRRADPAGSLAPRDAAEFAAAVHRRIRTPEAKDSLRPVSARGTFGPEWLPFAAVLALMGAFATGGILAYAGQRDSRSAYQAAAYARSVDPWLMHGPAADGAR